MGTQQSRLVEQYYRKALNLIDAAHAAACHKFREWPDNPYIGHVILSEEVGEAAKALIDREFKGASIDDAITEYAQAGAMCMRQLQRLLLIKEPQTNDD